MVTLPAGARAVTLRRLSSERFDVLIVGGGITGAGIARDAALRGLRTALVERDDFGSGTSSRSSRLIHGGVRYLEHGHLHLVFESSRERHTLLRVAKHLVRSLGFTWPVYRGARISRARLFAGLALYDALALFRNVAPHARLRANDVAARESALRNDGLLGGARYFDAATDDARLTLANILGAAEAGAAVLNHAAVVELIGHGGRAAGVVAVDAITGERLSIRATTIVNATGPESDVLQRLEATPAAPAIAGTKGAHVAVPRDRVGNREAVTMLHPADGRVLFALPAGRQTILSTTESAATGARDARASREDVAYLLAAANWYFPAAGIGDRDVIASWAGIRPLAAGLAVADASAASREHAVTVGALGVISVTGGKLTTFRAMAEDVVDGIVAARGRPYRQRGRTAHTALPGSRFETSLDLWDAAERAAVPDDLRDHLVRTYGTRWSALWTVARSDPTLAEPIAAGAPYLGAELAYAVEHEMAATLGDLLIRRTHLAFETPDHGLSVAPRAAALIAPRLQWDTARQSEEVRAYEREVERIFCLE